VNRRIAFLIFVLLFAWRRRDGARGQAIVTEKPTVTVQFSLQPLQSFLAVFGGRLVKIAEYSSETCNYTSAPIERSQGVVKQLAGDVAKINVVDFANSQPTAARAESRSRTSLAVSGIKVGLIALSVAAGANAALTTAAKVKVPAEIAAGSAATTGVLQAVQVPLNAAQAQRQQTAAAVMKTLLDPAITMKLAPNSCEEHGFFGELIIGFKSVKAVLP
jgi:hypothetical protein